MKIIIIIFISVFLALSTQITTTKKEEIVISGISYNIGKFNYYEELFKWRKLNK